MKRSLILGGFFSLLLVCGLSQIDTASAQREGLKTPATIDQVPVDPNERPAESPRREKASRSISGTEQIAAVTDHDAPSDFNGDGRTDWSIVRPGPNSQDPLGWWINLNGTEAISYTPWGALTDFVIPADYDGDKKDDIAVWRPGSNAGFWVLRSSDGLIRFTPFGQTGDTPLVVADYTGDGIDDKAIYRRGNLDSDPGFFWYLASSGPYAGQHVAIQWGQGADLPITGDFNGDGLADFTVTRVIGQAAWVYTSLGTADYSIGQTLIRQFGTATDYFVPGDYDGDKKTDLAVTRPSGGRILWIYEPSSGGPVVYTAWGSSTNPDFEVPGDYDGDGKTDIAVWRDTTNPALFIVNNSSGGVTYMPWGMQGDIPTIWEVFF